MITMNTCLINNKKKLAIRLICLFCAFLTSCSNKGSQPPAPLAPAMKASISTIPRYKEYIGITQSIAAAAIRARVEGFLLQKHFIEGKPVKKGQLLYVIDQKPFEAQVQLAEGNLARNMANQEFQHVEYIRMKELVKKGDVSQSDYDKVDALYKAAVASVDVARAQVEEAKINLGYCSMTSPFNGIIGKKYVDLGNLVGGSAERTVLANVVQLDPMYVEFSPSVSDFSEFLAYRENMPFKVKATLPHNNKPLFHGQVDLINNEADIPTSTILMRAVIDNPEQLLLPGIYVNISLLLTNKEKAILIPSKAIVDTQGLQNVFTVNAKNQVEVRSIVTDGQYQQQYIVKSGVKVGDIILTDGLQKIQPGETVTPQLAELQHG